MTMLETNAPLSILDAAVLAAERGLHVIPVWRVRDGICPCPRGSNCISPGKHPAIDSWQTAASTELTVLRDWFATDRHNLGVVCGPSNVAVIDVDPRNGGNETFAALVAELGPLPTTVTADSGGGGTHYVFQRPTGDLESKLTSGEHTKGVDLLRDARQFLVEPSMHPSGAAYRWRAGCGPDEQKIAQLPEAWIKKARRPLAPRPAPTPTVSNDLRIKRASAYLARCAAAVSGDSGHSVTFNAVAHVMFGFDLDANTTYDLIASEYNPRCDPPWSERELKHKIDSAAKTCKRTRGYLLDADRRPMHTTRQAADRAPEPATEQRTDWASELIASDKGKVKRGLHNVMTFVSLHPDYWGKWSLNTMTGEVWFDGEPMRDTLIHGLRQHIDNRLGFSPGREEVEAAIAMAAEKRPFHPIQNYLRSVDWDGEPRLSSMAHDFLSNDGELEAEVVRKWMISAVARALNPGCKVDTALMLYGEQGFFKSTFFAVLGGAWHADSPIDIANKDSFQQIHAAWLYEFAELENVVHGRAESRLKAWLTSTHDMYRAPYARSVVRKARSVVICGTTNRKQFLTDDTGSRRFWIVPVAAPVPRDLLAQMRDQLWAEAVCAYEAGEPWWLERAVEIEREDANAEFTDEDAWHEPIANWLSSPAIQEITMSEILRDALKLEISRQDPGVTRRVARILNAIGWRRRRETTGDRRWRYVRRDA